MIRTGSLLVASALALLAALVPPGTASPVRRGPQAAHAPGVAERPARRETPWSARELELAGALAVQDGGRVKPLSTYAATTLLRLNGRRSLTTPAGERLGATAWLLDVLVYPEQAVTYPCFQVQDSSAVHAIGLSVAAKGRRDRWSFEELRPAVPRLFELAHGWAPVEPGKRSTLQHQVVLLAEAVDAFLVLAGFLDFARVELPVPSTAGTASLFEGSRGVRYSDLVRRGPQLGERYMALAGSPDPLQREERARLEGLLRLASELGRASARLALLPPDAEVAELPAWHTPGELLAAALDGRQAGRREVEALVALEALADSAAPGTAREAALAQLAAVVGPMAAARGETRRLGLEIAYYRLRPLSFGLALFVAAFLASACSWLRPRARLPYWICGAGTLGGTLLLALAITMRCVIRERPPISTLYETVLFVTWSGAALGLVLEWIDRKRVALFAAALLGVVGLFLANGYETLERRDTMPSLVAVLDTNFWLATHVTTIVIGYAAGLFAALLASIYLVARALRGRAWRPELFRSLGRMTYGTIAFALIFSIVGTILGGIWANDSWGRFWGWDPKENGALLICLSQIAILHGRRGGYLKELGLCVSAAFAGTIIAFSWWGVNLLGVGLHSYGFTSGVHGALWTYYLLQWGVCALGAAIWWRERGAARPTSPAAAREPRTRAAIPAQPVPEPPAPLPTPPVVSERAGQAPSADLRPAQDPHSPDRSRATHP